MKRIAIAFVLLVAPNASAEPSLLVEVRTGGFYTTRFTEIAFDVGMLGGPLAGFSHFGAYTTDIIEPTPDELSAMATRLMDATHFRTYTNGIARAFHFDDIWANGTIQSFNCCHTGTADVSSFVPKLGSGLSGYTITAITQQAAPVDTIYGPEILQTTRIYGEAVPEPATLMLVALAFTMFAARRAR